MIENSREIRGLAILAMGSQIRRIDASTYPVLGLKVVMVGILFREVVWSGVVSIQTLGIATLSVSISML